MDVTSSRAGEQLQPQGLSRHGLGASSLVNVGISQLDPLPSGAQSWQPGSEFTPKKQGYLVKVDVYRNDALVKFDRTSIAPPEGTKRGEVTIASRESLNRLFLLANNASVEFRTFVTNTVHAALWRYFKPSDFKEVHNHYLIRAKRKGWGKDYLWAREHQENGAPHYHSFHAFECDATYTYFDTTGNERTVDLDRSRELSVWYTDQLAKRFRYCDLCSSGRYVECAAKHRFCGDAFRKMAFPKTTAGGFMGCCRVERIRDRENAGGYLSKECSKRLQKALPPGWNGRWWGASRGVVAVPIATDVLVDSDGLVSREVDTEYGTFEMLTKLQYGLGKRILDKRCTVQPKSKQEQFE